MRRFLTKLFLFLLLLVLVDRACYFWLARFEDRVHDQRLRKVVQGEMNKDILVFGSSRSAKGILPQQITDSTGLSAYNLSYSGADLSWQLFLLNTVVEFNSPPKAVLLTMDDPMEFWDQENYHFPFYNLYSLLHYDCINEALIQMGEQAPESRYFMVARLKGDHFKPDFDPVEPLDSLRWDGAQPIDHYHPKKQERGYIPHDPSRDLESKMQLLRDFEQTCQDNGIRLIIVYPPNFRDPNASFWHRVHSVTSPEALHFHYDIHDPMYQNKDMFYDMDHLHLHGAMYFTDKLIEFLKDALS